MSRASLIALVAAIALCSGCAVFNRDNTPTLNFVEDELLPEAKPARYFAYPLLLPVGLVALTIDAFIVRPITVADDALLDTKEALWEDFDWKEHYVTECFTLIPRTAFTPVVFPACFLARSTFDIEPKGGEPRFRRRKRPPSKDQKQAELIAKARMALEVKRYEDAIAKQAELIAEARKALEERRYEDAIALADDACKTADLPKTDALVVKAAALLELRDIDGFGSVVRTHRIPVGREIVAQRVKKLLRRGTPAEQVRLLLHLRRCKDYPEAFVDDLEVLLNAEDRAIAMKVLDCLGTRVTNPRIRLILERTAQGDDPVLAAAAQEYLK